MSISSKEKILSKIKKGLSNVDEIFDPSLKNEEIFVPLEEDRIISFAENFNKTAGQLIYCSKNEDFYDKFFEYKKHKEIKHLYGWGDDISQQIFDAGIEVIQEKGGFIDSCDAGVTLCEALVARTGSILVSSQQGGGRELNIYPPIHIVVAYTSQVVGEIEEALELVDNKYDKLPSMVSLTSGPSRTADIEKTLVMGAHGPKELILFLIDDSKD